MRRILYLFFLLVITSCATVPGNISSKQFKKHIAESPVFAKDFTGFALYDTESDAMVYEHESDKYYTPASNTKIFTLFSCLKILGDSIPAMSYTLSGDSLLLAGTGDPTLFHPDILEFDTTYDDHVYRFLSSFDKLYYVEKPIKDQYFGPGWAWSDYNYYYSSEKSVLPIYANIVRFQFKEHQAKPLAYPDYFTKYIDGFADERILPDYVQRNQSDNYFRYAPKHDTLAFTEDVPFKPDAALITKLLSDTLKKSVEVYAEPMPVLDQTLYSVPADSVYKRMMHISDNFFAEQLLLVCSSQLQDTISSDSVISYVKESFLQDLPDEPIWVDGSGLSRYNLQTPRSMVKLLQKVDAELSDEEIKDIFPAGGESGTIENWYKNEEGKGAYVFAKTGTLSNKCALSGFLFTKSGKKLIFSFLHNNYITSSSVLKYEMEKVLWDIYQNY